MTPDFDLLLVGAGHAHLGVLRQWMEHAPPPGRIGLLSEGAYAWYSGMLPGLLAGRYRAEQCRVSLAALCQASGVELIQGRVVDLDPVAQRLTLADERRFTGAWLSLNLGSRPKALRTVDSGVQLLPVKPFKAFLDVWSQWRQSPQPLAILGGGAAGVELALALAGQVPDLTLISAAPLLAGHPPALRERVLRHLGRAGIKVQEGVVIDHMHLDSLSAGGEIVWRGQRVILATGASPLPWLGEAGLDCDEQGFLRVGATLQCRSHPRIFAAGDCASLINTPRNGVYAVRQGPTLAANLFAALAGQPLRSFVPQRKALALLADGRGGALLSWAGLTVEGAWCGKWKDYLDRRFIRRHLAHP